MKSARILTLGAALALVLLAAFVPAANAEGGVTVSRFPISFSLFNPCTNENVDFSGTALGLIDTAPEDNHFIFHSVDIAIKGIGETTGALYVELFAITIALQGSDDEGPFAETNAVHSRLITPGAANDLAFEIVFHFTINANGDVVVFHNRVVFEACV